MVRLTKFLMVIRTALASTAALSVVSATQVEAQTEALQAYLKAKESGSVDALERFIERYPLSPEANDAFRDIVLLIRGSKLANKGPRGFFISTRIPEAPDTTSETRQVSVY